MKSARANQRQKSAGDDPKLPADYILKLKAELDSEIRLYAELPARIAEKKTRLNAAMQFAPDGFDLDKEIAAKSKKKPASPERQKTQPATPTWIGEVENVVAASPRGISHQEVLSAVKNTALGKNQSKGDKGFYNAIARLAKRGLIVKAGGLLYSAKLAQEMKKRGEALPDVSAEVGRRRNGSGAIVLRVLSNYPNGLPGPEIKRIVAEMPEAPRSMREHGQYIYNILGTLIGSGAVARDGGVYRLTRPQPAQQRSN